ATVTFSPDSRWLMAGNGTAFAVWDVVSGKLVRDIRRGGDADTGGAFSPDGKLLAVALGLSEVELIDPATWRPVAPLLGPEPSIRGAGPPAFSPDGGHLAVHTAAGTLRVWDLRRIRERLRELGLDWHLPAYPPRPHAGAKPMRVEVDPSEFQRHVRARQHLARGQDQALRDMAKALELADTNALCANNPAWLLATCPREESRDARRAVGLAQRAVLLAPRTGTYWNTLGVAYYRAGSWRRSVDALERSRRHQGANSWDWFFLAMAHW